MRYNGVDVYVLVVRACVVSWPILRYRMMRSCHGNAGDARGRTPEQRGCAAARRVFRREGGPVCEHGGETAEVCITRKRVRM